MFQAADRQAAGSSITWFCIKQPAVWHAMLHYYRHSRPAKRFNIPAKTASCLINTLSNYRPFKFPLHDIIKILLPKNISVKDIAVP